MDAFSVPHAKALSYVIPIWVATFDPFHVAFISIANYNVSLRRHTLVRACVILTAKRS